MSFTSKLRPKEFIFYPSNPVLQTAEAEIVAQNIMKFLAFKMGNKWQPITWEKYKELRLKDGEFIEGEKEYFDKVIPYCKNADTAQLFSEEWL